MSLPKHYRETLLSAALDGELTAQEQADFDREFAADHSFAREFEELQLLRSELHASLSGLRDQRISSAATARIYEAIAATANVASSSPPLGSATIQEVSRQSSRWFNTNRIAALFALAASMLIAVTLWNRNNVDVPVRNSIAALSDVQSLPKLNDSSIASTIEQPVQSKSPDLKSIASNRPRVAADGSKPNEFGMPPKLMGIKPNPASDLALAPEPMTSSPAQTEAPEVVAPDRPLDRQALSVVLVLSVELTDVGRDQHAMNEALRATDIRLGEESIMGDNVVSHLLDSKVIDANAADGAKTANLFFIEASAKRIDRFMSHLMSNPESFASVGLSLATEPPLLASVGDLREIDPTKVRQDANSGVARGIVSSNRRSLAIDPEYPFIPMSSDDIGSGLLSSGQDLRTNMGGDSSVSVVDDFPSQVLLLVK